MPIDWFTIAAQLVNFVVLVLLLRRFLYGPVLRAVQERDEKIAGAVKAADEKLIEAQREAEAYREKNRVLEETRDGLIRQAREEVHAWRNDLMQKAHREAQEAQGHWRRVLEEEKETFVRQLQQRVSHQAFVVARQALAEMANADLERHVVRVFVQRLATLSESDKTSITEDLAHPEEEVVISSAFELDEAMRQEIVDAVREHLGPVEGLRFCVSPDLICGIELTTHGRRLAWSLADYLAALEVHSLLRLPASDLIREAPNGR